MLAGLTPSPGEDSDQSTSAAIGQMGGPTYSGRIVPPPKSHHYIPSCSSPLPPVSERSVCHTETVYVSCHGNDEQPNQQSPTSSASTLQSISFSTEEASTVEQSEDESDFTMSANFMTPKPSFRCKYREPSTNKNGNQSEDESEATMSADFITPTPSFRCKSRQSSTIKNNEQLEDESEEEFITPTPSFRRKSRSLSATRNNESTDRESVPVAPLSTDFLSPTTSFRRSRLRFSSKIKNKECSEDESEATSAEFLTPNPSFRRKSRSLSNTKKNEHTEEESSATLSADYLSQTPSFRSKLRFSSKIETNECSDDESEATVGEFLTPNPSFRSKVRSSTIKTNEGLEEEISEVKSADFFTPTPSFRSKLRLSIEPITVQPTVVVRSTNSDTCACVGDIILEASGGEGDREMQILENSVPLNEDECHQPECAGHSHRVNGKSSTAPVDHNDEQSTASEIFCCDLFKIEITNEPHNHDNLDVARPSAEPIKSEPSTDLSPLSSQPKSAGKRQHASKTKLSRCFPF